MLYPSLYGKDPLYPKSQDFKVVHKDNLSGQGVMTFRTFLPGEILAKMNGDIITDIRQHTLQIAPDKHLFDPYFSGYFLHSCSPNISLNMRSMMVTALELIPAFSFLYMDYAETEDHLFKSFPCNCGSSNCRGWVTGKKDQYLNTNNTISQYVDVD